MVALIIPGRTNGEKINFHRPCYPQIRVRTTLAALLLLAVCTACGPQKVHTPDDNSGFPDRLSAWHVFTGKLAALQPAPGVLPYDLNVPLFSDYAEKRRFVWMPSGTAASYKPDGVFDFPVGTILSKTFSFGARHIETRLLVHTQSGWYTLPYVWLPDQSDATLEMTPAPIQITPSYTYVIPNANQCTLCHAQSHGGVKTVGPLGPKAWNLNRPGQLARWTRAGYLRSLPPENQLPPAPQSLDQRAKAYLEVNCAHCHAQALDPAKILTTMESTDPDIRMPNIAHTLVHREGVQLIRQWLLANTQKPAA